MLSCRSRAGTGAQRQERKTAAPESLRKTEKMSEKRSVIQYDDFGNELNRYKSIKEAQEVYNCTHISSVCRGKRMHDKGYVWKYEHELEPRPYRRRRKLYTGWGRRS